MAEPLISNASTAPTGMSMESPPVLGNCCPSGIVSRITSFLAGALSPVVADPVVLAPVVSAVLAPVVSPLVVLVVVSVVPVGPVVVPVVVPAEPVVVPVVAVVVPVVPVVVPWVEPVVLTPVMLVPVVSVGAEGAPWHWPLPASATVLSGTRPPGPRRSPRQTRGSLGPGPPARSGFAARTSRSCGRDRSAPPPRRPGRGRSRGGPPRGRCRGRRTRSEGGGSRRWCTCSDGWRGRPSATAPGTIPRRNLLH